MFPFLSKAPRILNRAKDAALDVLFPPICLNCRRPLEEKNKLVCGRCLSSIRLNSTLFCPVCRARLAENERVCHYDSRYLLAVASDYDDPVLQNLIHSFKYGNFRSGYFRGLAEVLGEILIEYLNLLNPKLNILNLKPVIIPIPLHPEREKERGFNQSKLIAEIVGRRFNLTLVDGLKRGKNNKPQMKLKGNEARSKNVAGCFEIKNPGLVRGRNVILVDDVFTSGATANEAVRILKAGGAWRTIVLVLAKA